MKTKNIVFAIVILGVMVFLFACQPVMPASQIPERVAEPEPVVVADGKVMEPEKPVDEMPPTVSGEPGALPPAQVKFEPTGKVLAGTTSPYVEFSQADFDRARAQGKIVYLEFHAFWCPFCARLDPKIRASFTALDDPEVVGFRVNYDKERDLKKKYNVIYQHTHIIIKPDGEVSWKSLDTDWNPELFEYEIAKAKGEV